MAREKNTEARLPTFSPIELVGKTFLKEGTDGEQYRAKVVRKIQDMDAENHQRLKFLVEVGDHEELMTYTELCDALNDQDEESPDDRLWCFERIKAHEGPLNTSDKAYKGCKYNVFVEWSDGSETWEPLTLISKDDPLSCARYAKQHDLLDTPGWKHLKRFAKKERKVQRMIYRMKARRRGTKYKFGIEVPLSTKDSQILEEKEGHNKWSDSRQKEHDQLFEYETFIVLDEGEPPPHGFQEIPCHFVYDIKEDLRYKSRFVAGGHVTDTDREDSYSGVVGMRTLRMALIIGLMNGLN